MTNTTLNYEGTSYTLVEEAYLTNYKDRAVYEAEAIATGSTEDELGLYEMYTLRWEIIIDGDMNRYNEEDLCDWENPDDIYYSGLKSLS